MENERKQMEATNGFVMLSFLLAFNINRWVPGGISRNSANSLWDSRPNFLFMGNEHVSFHVQRLPTASHDRVDADQSKESNY